MSDPLPAIARLAAQDLDRLATLVGIGRIAVPFSALSLQQEGFGDAPAIAGDLNVLEAGGFNRAQMTTVLQTLASVQRRGEAHQNRIELVVTGPDAAGAARDTAIVIADLFSSASRSVLATGFALYRGQAVFQRLVERMDAIPSLEVKICLDISRQPGDTARDEEVMVRFAERFQRQEWPGRRLPKLYFDPRALAPWNQERAVLHAKCIVIDDTEALVTSANLTTAAQERNIELGLLVKNPAIAAAVRQHFERLIEKGYLVRVPM